MLNLYYLYSELGNPSQYSLSYRRPSQQDELVSLLTFISLLRDSQTVPSESETED